MTMSTIGPARIVGRYAVYGEIAAGGMATVHYGRLLGQVGFSRTVAVKRLHPQFAKDPDFVAMLLDEARLAGRISHPNVASVLDVVAEDGELCLVMDYLQGESLARLNAAARARGVVIPPRIACAILCGVLRGLHAAHEACSEQGEPLGIVHRDCSPQNVLVDLDGAVHVIDFGVAKALGRRSHTREGQLKGKLAYMAPEQLGGQVSRQTDVFAAATVLWETLTGESLFMGDNDSVTMRNVLNKAPAPPSQYFPSDHGLSREKVRELDAIVACGFEHSLERRFRTARDMANALEGVGVAAPSEISDWVESLAGEILRKRQALVAAIETRSALDAIDRPSKDRLDDDAGSQADSPAAPAVALSVGVTPPSATLLPPSRHRWALGLSAAVILALAGVSGALLVHKDEPIDLSTATAEEPAAFAPEVTAGLAPEPAVAEARPVTRVTATEGRARAPVRKAASRPCELGYYFDSAGRKHYKACLKQ
jgi:serine/threonine protein kinase